LMERKKMDNHISSDAYMWWWIKDD
jgi:hypothetical protein